MPDKTKSPVFTLPLAGLVLAFFIALILSGCAAGTGKPSSSQAANAGGKITVTGDLVYRERILLSPGHVLKVTLEDVSIADKAADILAMQSRNLNGEQIPLSFALTANRDMIKPRGRYSVRAVIKDADGDLKWTTDAAHLIETGKTDQDMGMLNMVHIAPATEDAAKDTKAMKPKTLKYSCGDQRVTAVYSDGQVTLRSTGMTYILDAVRAASGAKYETGNADSYVMWWEKGDKAMFQMGAHTLPECRVLS